MAGRDGFVPGGASPSDNRMVLAGLLTPQGPGPLDIRTGVFPGPGTPYAVTGTASTAPMQVSVAAGHDVALRTAQDGPDLGANDGPVLVDIGPAPASNSRIDLVWKRQTDVDRDAATAVVFGVTEGPVGAPPVPDYDSVPAGALVLYEVTVAAGAVRTTDPQVTLTRVVRNTVARGGILPVANQAERDALTPYAGMEIFRTDTKAKEIWDGTRWVTFDTQWFDYTPVFTNVSGGGTNVGSTGILKGKYTRLGGTCHYSWAMDLGGVGVTGGVAGGVWEFSLPLQADMTPDSRVNIAGSGWALNGGIQYLLSVHITGDGLRNQLTLDGNSVVVTSTNPTAGWEVGDAIRASGTYEIKA